jgi:hypothetical protein
MKLNPKATDVANLIADVNGGELAIQLGTAISLASGNAVVHGKAAKVLLALEINPIKGTNQASSSYKISYQHPTATGKLLEDMKGETILHVGEGGRVALTQKQLEGVQSAIPA